MGMSERYSVALHEVSSPLFLIHINKGSLQRNERLINGKSFAMRQIKLYIQNKFLILYIAKLDLNI